MDTLTEHQRAVLAVERKFFRTPGAKDDAIRDQFGLSPVRYYQLLAALIQTEAAMRHDPLTVKRLLRVSRARHP